MDNNSKLDTILREFVTHVIFARARYTGSVPTLRQVKLRQVTVGIELDFGRDFWHFFQFFVNSHPFIYRGRTVSPVKNMVYSTSLVQARSHFFLSLVIFLGKGCEGFGEAWGSWGIPWDTLGGSGEALGRLFAQNTVVRGASVKKT